MIERAYRFLLALYPAGVRREFGGEMWEVFLAAHADARARGRWAYLSFCAREMIGMMSGLVGHGGVGRHWRWIMACAALGALAAGFAVWREAQGEYVSRAVLRITAPQVAPSVLTPELISADDVAATAQLVLSRASVTALVNSLGLYPEERRRQPMETIVERFRQSVKINRQADFVTVAFTYRDPKLAQRAVMSVVSKLTEEVLRQRRSRVRQTEQFLEDMTTQAARDLDAAMAASAAASSQAAERAKLDVAQASRHYQSLREKHAETIMRSRLEERKQGSLLELVDAPSLPFESLARTLAPWSILIGAGAGLMAGLFAGSLAAWFWDWWPRHERARAH